ncbi:MAG: hypothetical protein ABI846_07695 [Rudaea sp.]
MHAIALFLAVSVGAVGGETPQEHVHHESANVMPFEMAKTLHVFRMTELGGEQRVIVRGGADRAAQIRMIREHLLKLRERFAAGDYGDPATLHGARMPGLGELRVGAARVHVGYADLPDGAALTFETRDPHLLTEIHRWFGAQLSEHGADAVAE